MTQIHCLLGGYRDTYNIKYPSYSGTPNTGKYCATVYFSFDQAGLLHEDQYVGYLSSLTMGAIR
jgi:hypothetical protein